MRRKLLTCAISLALFGTANAQKIEYDEADGDFRTIMTSNKSIYSNLEYGAKMSMKVSINKADTTYYICFEFKENGRKSGKVKGVRLNLAGGSAINLSANSDMQAAEKGIVVDEPKEEKPKMGMPPGGMPRGGFGGGFGGFGGPRPHVDRPEDQIVSIPVSPETINQIEKANIKVFQIITTQGILEHKLETNQLSPTLTKMFGKIQKQLETQPKK